MRTGMTGAYQGNKLSIDLRMVDPSLPNQLRLIGHSSLGPSVSVPLRPIPVLIDNRDSALLEEPHWFDTITIPRQCLASGQLLELEMEFPEGTYMEIGRIRAW